MNKIEKHSDEQEQQNIVDGEKKKKIEQKTVIDQGRNSTFALAEKIILQPIQKWLESLKRLIQPEKKQYEVKEKISILNESKHQEKKNILLSSKKNLEDFQNSINYSDYTNYAKRWIVELAKSESAISLLTNITQKDPNPIADSFRKIAEWWLS